MYGKSIIEIVEEIQNLKKSKEPKKEKMFFYVFVPGNGEPIIKHDGLRSAKKEAQRLAKKTGKETFILQAIKSYKVSDIVETNFI